MNVIWSNN